MLWRTKSAILESSIIFKSIKGTWDQNVGPMPSPCQYHPSPSYWNSFLNGFPTDKLSMTNPNKPALCITTKVILRVCVLSHFSHVQHFGTLWTVAQPGSSVHGMLQARILEWIAMLSSRGSSWLRERTQVSHVSCIGRLVLYHQCLLGSPKVIFLNANQTPA